MEKVEEENKQQGITQKDTRWEEELTTSSAVNPCSIKVYKHN